MRAALLAILLFLAAMTGAPRAMAGPVGPPSIDPAPTTPAAPAFADPRFILDPPDNQGSSPTINPLRVLEQAGASIPQPEGSPRRAGLSVAMNILIVLTVVTLVPSIMLMTTCFLRILVVLGLLKQAMGTATIPPAQVITALALFMTLLVMAPTIDRINKEAVEPYRAGHIESYDELWNAARQPVRDFMFDQIEATGNWSSVYMMLEYRGVDTSDPSRLSRNDVDMVSLIPAYMLSELKTAFLKGFRIYLPFRVSDMVISTMLISMSMMMLPPVLVSLPFKLLLFVMVDGWTLVVGGLMHSFRQGTLPGTLSWLGDAHPLAAILT